MNCRRSEELWSDLLDGRLSPPLERELLSHLGSCSACSSLHATFREVVAALGSLTVPESPETLAERIVARTRPSLETARRDGPMTTAPPPKTIAAASWLAVAAVVALVLLWRPPEVVSDFSSQTSRTAHQVYSFGVRSYHQSARWLEDLKVLRMTVGVAFEDRLDRLNEHLRSLEEAGRKSKQGGDEQSREERSRHRESPARAARAVSYPSSRSHS